MARIRWRLVAGIEKTHGRKGEVVAVPAAGLPPLLCEGMTVACVPPVLEMGRYHVVEHVGAGVGTGQLVRLSGADGLEESSRLVGSCILALADELPDDIDSLDLSALIGREVSDSRFGALGQIEEIMCGAAHDVWVVQGPFGEVLVPAVEPIVREMGQEGPILVDLPDGLVEVN